MNTFQGNIIALETHESLTRVKVRVGPEILSSIVIDTPDTSDYLTLDEKVNVIFKETEVIIGPGKEHQVSLRNKIVGKVARIDSDQLMSRVVVNTDIGMVTSIITTNAVQTLPVNIDDEVTVMIKTNEVMLSKSPA